MLLIDACHSGELDKTETNRIATSGKTLSQTSVTHKAIKGIVYEEKLGMDQSYELMQDIFINVAKGTRATVIAAAGGLQYALEKGDLKNGVFTYSILETFKNANQLKVSELKKIVSKRVLELTDNLQRPTSRTETSNWDWVVW